MFLLACERLEVTASETLEEITICVGMLDRARVVRPLHYLLKVDRYGFAALFASVVCCPQRTHCCGNYCLSPSSFLSRTIVLHNSRFLLMLGYEIALIKVCEDSLFTCGMSSINVEDLPYGAQV
jgi:hypothetical protein